MRRGIIALLGTTTLACSAAAGGDPSPDRDNEPARVDQRLGATACTPTKSCTLQIEQVSTLSQCPPGYQYMQGSVCDLPVLDCVVTAADCSVTSTSEAAGDRYNCIEYTCEPDSSSPCTDMPYSPPCGYSP